jgi:hypothetical protein
MCSWEGKAKELHMGGRAKEGNNNNMKEAFRW